MTPGLGGATGTSTAASLPAIVQRTDMVMALTASGSGVVVAVNDTGAGSASWLLMISTADGRVMWRLDHQPTIASLAIAPDGKTVAVGFRGVSDSAAGVNLLQTDSGEQVGALGFVEKFDFAPGVTYPQWGDGVAQLALSPDGALLYGLSNDTLFAWEIAGKRYLWTRDVPAVVTAPRDRPDPLPYGHATSFALSPDGRQIAVARDVLRVATAGRDRPLHFVRRDFAVRTSTPARPTFSSGLLRFSGTRPHGRHPSC